MEGSRREGGIDGGDVRENECPLTELLLKINCCFCGIHVVFLPKFYCELNFIEQCWGQAKGVYRTYPSSCEDDLKTNTLQVLASIPLSMMRKFVTQSCCFMDAYDCGLNGRQVAWAACKY